MPSKSNPAPFVVVGNWKMHKTLDEAEQFLETVPPLIEKSQVLVCLAVPFTLIHMLSRIIEKKKLSFMIGAQNMNDASEGAFTGEIAARMLLDAGAHFVLLGHSERRHIFHETSSFINKKVKRALADGILPILCIGETFEEREQGKTHEVLEKQLLECLEGVAAKDIKDILLAYEPVWAIGSGKPALPKDAAAAHQFCREVLTKKFGKRAADKVVILYGGSVKPENALSFMQQPDVRGFLIGGSSLSPESFCQIINSYQPISV